MEAFDCRRVSAARAARHGGRLSIAWLLTLAIPGVTVAAAQTPSSHAGDETRIRATIGAASYAAEERRPDGHVLNREEGWLWRTTVGIRHAAGSWVIDGSFRQVRGTLDYTGQTQLGLPLLTKTGVSHFEFGATGGYRWRFSRLSSIALIGGAEAVRSARGIRATAFTTDLTEILRSRHWVIGSSASTTLALAGRALHLRGSAELTRPWWQELGVDTHGLTDAIALAPRPRWGQRLVLEVVWDIGASIEVGASAGHDILRAGSSPNVTVYRSGEPVGTASFPGRMQTVRHASGTITWRF